MNTMELAQKIKGKCKDLNITISKLIEDCNLSKSLIYDLEKRNTYISIDKLFKISKYLNCSSDYLLGLNESKNLSQKQNINNLNEHQFNIQNERIIKVFNSLNTEYKNVAINEIITLIKNNINIDFKNLELLLTALDDNLKDDILNILIDLSLKFSDEQIKKANENKAYIAALGGGVTEIDEDLANYIIKNAVPNKPKIPDLKNL